jgi:hypothetical protein
MRRSKKRSIGSSEDDRDEDSAVNDDVEKAMQKAEDAAQALIGVKKPTKQQVTDVLLLIDAWPMQTRPNVTPNGSPVTGFSMGLVFGLGGLGLKVSKVSQMFPALTMLLTRYTATSVPDKQFKFSSLQVNYNYAAKAHVDGNNLGPSYIQALGDHTGGALWTGDQGVVDCNGCWKKFNGCAMHATQPFKGTRISLIPFTNNAYEELDDTLCDSLRTLGFQAVGTARIRDRGDVAEETFDEHWAARRKEAISSLEGDAVRAKEVRKSAQEKQKQAKVPGKTPIKKQAKAGTTSLGAGANGGPKLVVDVAGWACGRGSAWVAFDTGKKQAVEVIDFAKNTTGFHCVGT